MKLPLSKYSVDGSSGERSWALLKCLAQAGGSDKESHEGAGGGYYCEDDEEEDEDDGSHDAEAVEKPKTNHKAKRKRIALGEGVASTARSRSRACMSNTRPTYQ